MSCHTTDVQSEKRGQNQIKGFAALGAYLVLELFIQRWWRVPHWLMLHCLSGDNAHDLFWWCARLSNRCKETVRRELLIPGREGDAL